MRAEHAPDERLVAPNPWATLSVHVVASPASRAALEVGGLTVHSFTMIKDAGRVHQRRETPRMHSSWHNCVLASVMLHASSC